MYFHIFGFRISKFSIGHFQREYMPLLDKPHYLWGVWLPDPGRLLYFLFHTSGSSNSLKKRKKCFRSHSLMYPSRACTQIASHFQKHDASGITWFQRDHMFEHVCPPRILNSLPARCSGYPWRVLLFCFSIFLSFRLQFSFSTPLDTRRSFDSFFFYHR